VVITKSDRVSTSVIISTVRSRNPKNDNLFTYTGHRGQTAPAARALPKHVRFRKINLRIIKNETGSYKRARFYTSITESCQIPDDLHIFTRSNSDFRAYTHLQRTAFKMSFVCTARYVQNTLKTPTECER